MQEIEIQKLRFPESIRKRATMYIGHTEDPSNIIRELIDNANDELMSGYAKKISILATEQFSAVMDDGRGLPTYPDEDYEDQLITESIFTEIHTGSKFSSIRGEYKSGLHGIGSTATNALSERFIAAVNLSKKLNEDKYLYLEYREGIKHCREFLTFEKLLERLPDQADFIESFGDWSTFVCSYPDKKIFKSLKFQVDTTSLRISLTFAKHDDCSIFLNGNKLDKIGDHELLGDSKLFKNKSFRIEAGQDDTKFIIVFGYSADDYDQSYRGSVNTLTTNSGIHVNSAKRSFCKALSEEINKFDPRDFLYGIRMFTLVFCSEPEFSSQSKERLSGIRGSSLPLLEQAIEKATKKIVRENREFFDAISNRIFDYKKEIGRLAVKDYLDTVLIKGDSKKSRGLGIGVYDCNVKDRKLAELYVVEGKSAGSNILQVRSTKTQALLCLRGKPINATRVEDLRRVFDNKEMKSLINVIGAGVSPYIDIAKARYGKIILCADPDPDGRNITAILLGTFSSYLKELIDNGMVYITQIPLYKQNGKFIFEESELNRKKQFTRFKGLGEMNPEELEETAVDPKSRRIIQISADNGSLQKALKIVRSSSAKKSIMINNNIVLEQN